MWHPLILLPIIPISDDNQWSPAAGSWTKNWKFLHYHRRSRWSQTDQFVPRSSRWSHMESNRFIIRSMETIISNLSNQSVIISQSYYFSASSNKTNKTQTTLAAIPSACLTGLPSNHSPKIWFIQDSPLTWIPSTGGKWKAEKRVILMILLEIILFPSIGNLCPEMEPDRMGRLDGNSGSPEMEVVKSLWQLTSAPSQIRSPIHDPLQPTFPNAPQTWNPSPHETAMKSSILENS